MEVQVLEHRGIPGSGLLSISAGGMRKQVQISQIDGPLRFPGKVDDYSQVKVDVLDVLGRARLPYQAFEQKYTLPLDPTSGGMFAAPGSMEVDILMRPVAPSVGFKPTKEEKEEARQRKEVDAQSYLEEHGLVGYMQFLLHSLMQDKPADPYHYIQQQVSLRQASRAEAFASPAGVPDLTAPSLQDTEVESLLERVSPAHAAKFSPEELTQLEREAEQARQKLLEDNATLRDTAFQMNQEYEKLMRESASLHGKQYSDRVAKMECTTREALKEVEKLQGEVSHLARDNGKLVQDLVRGREMMASVRQDMLELQQTARE